MIHLTERAVEKVRMFYSKDSGAQGKALRIYVKDGGCSGMEYGFSFDEKKEGDNEVVADGIHILIDSHSEPFIKDSTVDYIEDFRGAGFVVQNPNAKSTCGCGTSFSAS